MPTVYNNNCHYYTELHDSWAISIFSLQASTPVTLAPNLAEQWNIISPDELMATSGNTNVMSGNVVDETKLKKAHRKLRVFLHPDRLPVEGRGEGPESSL